MLDQAVAYLCCPHCRGNLLLDGRSLRCRAGHSFDVARQGYASLLGGDARTGTADTAAMVAAREAFLGRGHYARIRAAVADACAAVGPDPRGCVLDVGAGTGYHLAEALERLPEMKGVALDVSRHALRRAARAHPRMAAVGGDAWRMLPLRDGVVSVALNVFAPRDGDELARVLAPGGALVLVTPTGRHLAEAIAALDLLTVDDRKRERLEGKLGGRFDHAGERSI